MADEWDSLPDSAAAVASPAAPARDEWDSLPDALTPTVGTLSPSATANAKASEGWDSLPDAPSGGALSVFAREAAHAPLEMVGQAAKSIATTATPSVTPDQSSQFLNDFSNATTDDQRQALTAKAISVLPKPLAMDYNAALQRVTAGSDPVAERAKLEGSFTPWTMGGTPAERHGPLYSAGEAITDFGRNTVGATPTEQAVHPRAASFGQGVGTVASIALLNPAIGTPAALAAGAALFGLSSQQDTYEDAINHGSDEATARKAASISGGVNAAVGMVPVGNVLHPFTKFMPEASGWAMRMLARAGQNSVTFGTVAEAQNYLGQQVAKLYNADAGYDLPFTTRMATERLMGELAAGALVGGFHSTITELGNRSQAVPAVVPPEQHVDALNNILGEPPPPPPPPGAAPQPLVDEDQSILGGGRPVSDRQSLQTMIDNGASVADLAEHPMVQRALQQNRAAVPTGTAEDFQNPEWRDQRVYNFGGEQVQGWDNAVDRLTDQAQAFSTVAPVENNRHAVFVLGPPASGKSAISEPLARNLRAAIVDPDEAKKVIPEYNNGLGTMAVHEESSDLSKDVLRNLVVQGANIILPKVGGNPDSIRRQMGLLKDAGYTVDIAHVAATPEIAGQRNIRRFLKTGRLVDPNYITEVGDNPRQTAYMLRGEANDFVDADTSKPAQYEILEGSGPLADTLRGGKYGGLGPRAGNAGSAGNPEAQGLIGAEVPGIQPHRVTAADGTSIDTAPVVVEADSLRTSQDPGYDLSLQPRQRDRAASQAQVRDIATNLDPERLGYSAEADRGAPIVGPDGMVESGNGRVLALRSVYDQDGPQAQAYRAWLSSQGVDVAAYRNPVLVRQRTTPLAPDQRQAFTVAANQAATLSMSAPERALADARLLDSNAISLIHNPDDLGSAGNRAFVRRFVAQLPQGEQGMMADAKGALSADGLARVRNAVLAKAYGDAGLLARIAESTNDEVRSISSALTAAAPQWARLRAEIEAGRVRPDMDATPHLLDAVARTADIRGRGDKLDAYLAQRDAFDRLPTPVEGFMRIFYDPKGQRAASAKRISDEVKFYAQEAAKVSSEEGLGLGLVPVRPEDIVQRALERQRESYGPDEGISDSNGFGNGPFRETSRGETRGPWLGEGRERSPEAGNAGDQEAAVRAQQLTVDEQRRLTTERVPLAGGRTGEQFVFPGTERITAAELAKRRAAEPLRPKAAQQPLEEGLFGGKQLDLVDQARTVDTGTIPPQIKGTETANVGAGPQGSRVRQGTPQVPRGQQSAGTRGTAPIRKPEQLSLFGGTAGERSVPNADDAAQKQQASPGPAVPGPSDVVTKPPARSRRVGETRPDTPAVAGIREAENKIAQRSQSNYRITDEDQIGVGGPKQKVRANIDAIRILKTIEDEARDATPGEKAQLVKYAGWGAFAQEMFDSKKPEWKAERDALRTLITDEEYNAAKGSTLNAHYTSPDVIKGIWDAINHLGYDGGMALEPAAGVGHFVGLIPDKVAPKTAWTAVELDPLTGRIAKTLYGGAEVNVHGFEDLKRPSNYYDLAVSNVPFGNYNITEKPYGTFPIHDFFFVKSLDKVRPGGVVSFITSRYSMDRVDPGTRRLLAKTSDLVGAIRLPGGNKGAFAGNAGTAVTTDIMFLRKKIPGEAPFPGANWMDLKEVQTPDGPAKINEYFADHPEMMLGEMRLQGTMYRDNEPVLIGDATNLQDKILAAARNMPEGAFTTRDAPPPPPISGDEIATGIKDGAFFIKDGDLYQRRQGQGFAHTLGAEDNDRVKRFVGMRDIVNDLLAAQLHPGEATNQPNILRANLQKAYDAFVKEHGPINKEVRTVTNRLNKAGEPVTITRYPNIAKFMLDPDAWKVAAIEKYDPDTGKATRATIQTKDVINPPMERQINGPSDALAASLDSTGGVDLDHIAQSLNLNTQDEVVHALGDLIYQNPDGRKWETADNYLSGNVVKKLEDARAIAQEDPSYLRNVSSLEKIQPEPLTGADITAQFGAPWVPADVYADFLKEVGGSDIKVSQVPITGEWKAKASFYSRDARSKYGTDRVAVDKVVDAALNNRQLTVWDEDSDGNKHVNEKATTEARVKVDALKEAFTGDQDHGIDGWAFADPDRAQKLEGIFNRTYNNLVQRKFDGSHLTLPGLNPDFAGRAHRNDAVWRMIQNGNTLLAHVVGSGKSATMYAGAMEMKRLGLINKPLMTIPNHMLEQFSREFVQAYPDAKILVASKDETTRENRKEFLAKVAANDWDSVIMTHDAFGRINMGQDYRRGFIQDQMDELERVMRAEKEEGGKNSPTVKGLEKAKKKLEGKLDALMNEERKDAGTTFEESGVDFLFVDEAHKFKNLAFITRLQRVKGLAQGDSQRAEDLFLKIQYLEQKRPGRSAVFATGTPVSNTMAELWTMMRYLELPKLKERGLDTFDNWANTFGRVVNNMELSADGRTFKEVSSFSKFVNVPELISLYSEIADTKTADMLNLPRPEVKTRSGAPGIEIVEATPSSQEEDHIQKLVELAEKIKGKRPEKGQPNMLSIVTAGRKVATDGRLISPDFDFNPQGKIAKAVGNISRIYKEGNADPSAPNKVQMVFLDMGVPKTRATGKRKTAEDIAGDAGNIDPAQVETPRIDLYADIKQRLVDAGIPAREIAAIHDATDDAKKARLFQRVRSGDIRVLLGSSEKMGVGTNVQDRLIAMHHLDAPWKPAEVEQRDGRIVRQGNMNPNVQIYRYVTKKSFDAFMWQKLDTKSKFIGQVLSGAKGSRHAEDIDNPLPEAAEMKAAASGDPRIIEHAELDRQVRALTAQRRSFESTKSRATWEVGTAKSRIEQYESTLPNARDDAAAVQDLAGPKFAADLGGTIVNDRKAAGQAILDRLLAVDPRTFYSPKVVNVGKLSGFDMNVELRNGWDGDGAILRASTSLKGKSGYGSPNDTVINAQTDPGGLIRRFENILGNIKTNPERLEGQLSGERESVSRLEKTLGETWPKEKDYRAALAKLDDLTKSLSGPKHPDVAKAEEAEVKAQQPAARRGWDQAEGRDLGPRPGEKVVPIGRKTEAHIKLSDQYTAAEQKIADAVKEIGDRMAPQATVAGASALRMGGSPIWGAFVNSKAFPHLIAWSLERQNAAKIVGTVRHEIIHHLRAAGLIRLNEWDALHDAAMKDNWIGKYSIDDRYPGLSLDHKVEEAVAEHFAQWRVERSIEKPGLIRDAFQRIDLLLRRVAAAARSFLGKDATADDVFTRIETGEVGKRQSDRLDAQKAYYQGSEAAAKPQGGVESILSKAREEMPSLNMDNGNVANGFRYRYRAMLTKAGMDFNEANDRMYGIIRGEESAPKAQTPGEEARKRRETVTPKTIGQQIVKYGDGLRNKAADFAKSIGVDQLVQEMQMKAAPMAARNATVESRAIAKEFMNDRRQARQSWNVADKYIMEHFSHDERREMWNAADEESVAIQQGRPTTGIGLDRLRPDQRAVVEMLQARGRKNFEEAKSLGMVEGEGLPSYAPRMLVKMSEGGYERGVGPKAEVVRDIRTLAVANANLENAIATRRLIDTIADAGKRSGNPTVNDGGEPTRRLGAEAEVSSVLDQLGRGTSATTPQLRHRKYLTTEETEAAANRVPTPDENAPHWFTLDHPAFKRMVPRMTDADPVAYREAYKQASGVKMANVQVPARDEDGNIIFDKKPIYIRDEFEGPLRAILSRDNSRFYRGLMALKGKVMSVVMFSPLIHNQVEWGRALPAAPGKVVTFQTYLEGNKVANDPAQMRKAISGGVVPIGGHGYMQDIVSIAEAPTLKPGRGLVAKGLGHAVEGVGKLTQLYDPRSTDIKVREAVDWFGNLWHNTLLWDRVRDLQMGLWSHLSQHLVDKGYNPYSANVAAAHFANRYAGALPLEAMSGLARGVANVLLFSRSFTLGNIGAYKDAVLGLPRDAQALIQQKLGWDELQKIQGYVKRKSQAMLAIDAGLYYATLSALQSSFNVAGLGHTVATLGGMIAGGALGGKGGTYGRLAAAVGLGAAGFGLASVLGASPGTRSLEDELGHYWDRFSDLLKRVGEHPFETLGNPFKMIDSLGATAENEPGKQNRILLGYDQDGTAIYGRLAAGKVTEELIGYATEPNEMLHRKLGTFARPLSELYNNDYGFGRKVYNPKADTPAEVGKNIAKIAGLLITDQLPWSSLTGLYDWIRGGQGSGTAGLKAAAPLFGTTVSSGYPGGPELGVLADAKAKQDYRQQEAMPGIRDQIRQGDTSGAVAKMVELKIPDWLQRYYIATTLDPSARLSKTKMQQFMRYASPEEQQQFLETQKRHSTEGSAPAQASGGSVVARAAGGRVEPKNINHNPSPAQIKSGNYKKDRLSWNGIPLTIENAKGSIRRGTGKDGPWQSTLPAHYGYARRSEGADGDALDFYLGPHKNSPHVFVLDQVDADSRKFDEHKILANFGSKKQAIEVYKRAFSDGNGHARIGHVREMTIDQLKHWMTNGDTTKPIEKHAIPDIQKLKHATVEYVPVSTKSGQNCAKCSHFLPPAACEGVRSPISPRGYCVRFEPSNRKIR